MAVRYTLCLTGDRVSTYDYRLEKLSRNIDKLEDTNEENGSVWKVCMYREVRQQMRPPQCVRH